MYCCTSVECDVADTEFFARLVFLGPNGVEKVYGIGKLNEYEIDLLKKALPDLQKNIKRGQEFAATY
ncbi:unnamed protein product [Mesocestoides corti]|uniref:Ldh_1_C domain-containing protein n=1 Tax=Mesocestoides corti TaxID=53468 RepID=A0A0R3U714_MESCO|nr:unnamed protein product [Mesocestoides corti]